jgi:GNAT superfamily N-acetyltransferase
MEPNKKDVPQSPFSKLAELDEKPYYQTSDVNLLKLAVKKKKMRPVLIHSLTPTKTASASAESPNSLEQQVSRKIRKLNPSSQANDFINNPSPNVNLTEQLAFLNQQFSDNEDNEFHVDEEEMRRVEQEDEEEDIQLQNENPPTNGPNSVLTDPPTASTYVNTLNSNIYRRSSHSNAAAASVRNQNRFTPLESNTPSGSRRLQNPIMNLNREYSYVNESTPGQKTSALRNIPEVSHNNPTPDEANEEEDYEEDLEAFDDEADKLLDEIEYKRLFKSLEAKETDSKNKEINNAVNKIGSYGIPITEEKHRKIFQTENEKNMDNLLKNMGVDLFNFNENEYNEEEDLDYVANEEDVEEDDDDDEDLGDLDDDLVNDLENEDDIMWFGQNYLRNSAIRGKQLSGSGIDVNSTAYQDANSNKFEERPRPLTDKLVLPGNEGTFNVTLYPIYPANSKLIPSRLINFLKHEYNQEISKGQTLQHIKPLTTEEFGDVWFKDNKTNHIIDDEYFTSMSKMQFDPHDGVFFILVLDSIDKLDPARVNKDTSNDSFLNHIRWESQCLGVFNILPCYEGRSSHICTANFLVNEGIRNKCIGSYLMEKLLFWAPKLGYAMVQFPLVYDSNKPMIKILDKFNFKILGKLPSSAILLGHGDPASSTSYYKELGTNDTYQFRSIGAGNHKGNWELTQTAKSKTIQNYLSTTDGHINDVDANGEIIRFKLLQQYMLTGQFPFDNMDRAHKAKMRALRYRYQLDGEGRLYLKGREVISNIFEQKNIVREVHNLKHWQVNKMNRIICKDYYWPSLRKTIAKVYSECKICNDRHKRRNMIVNGFQAPITVTAINSSNGVNTVVKENNPKNEAGGVKTGTKGKKEKLSPSVKVDISKTKVAEEAKKTKKRGRPRTRPLVSKFKIKGISFNYDDKSNKEKTKATVKIDHFDAVKPEK